MPACVVHSTGAKPFLLNRLNIPIKSGDHETFKSVTILANEIYDCLKDKECLFVLDNVDNKKQVKDTLSQMKHHFTLITSRLNRLDIL